MLDLNLIRTDGGTQSRVKLNEDIVAEYAEAYKAGAAFPPVTVFFDGSDRWLADGFHRFFGAKKAGKKTILETIIPGTLRDAKLHSFGANGAHGQRPTNADKRKAVEAMLSDAEWSQWSDREIAKRCLVTHPFVAGIRKPKAVTVTTPASKNDSVEADAGITAPPEKEQVKAIKAPKVEAEDVTYFGPSDEELQAAADSANADMVELETLMQADDKLAEAVATIKRQKLQIAAVESARDGYMNRCNELISRVVTLKRQLKKSEAANV